MHVKRYSICLGGIVHQAPNLRVGRRTLFDNDGDHLAFKMALILPRYRGCHVFFD